MLYEIFFSPIDITWLYRKKTIIIFIDDFLHLK